MKLCPKNRPFFLNRSKCLKCWRPEASSADFLQANSPEVAPSRYHSFWSALAAVVMLFWISGRAEAQTNASFAVPVDRCINWAAMPVGFPGGIPNRTVIYKDVVKDGGVDNTGATD